MTAACASLRRPSSLPTEPVSAALPSLPPLPCLPTAHFLESLLLPFTLVLWIRITSLNLCLNYASIEHRAFFLSFRLPSKPMQSVYTGDLSF